MLKNMTRKGLALSAGLALVATGFVATPAQATATGLLWSKYGPVDSMTGVSGFDFNLQFANPAGVSAADPNTANAAADLQAQKDELAGQVAITVVAAAGKTAPTVVETIDATTGFATPAANTTLQAVLEVDADAGGAAITSVGRLALVAPTGLDYNLQVDVQVTYDDGSKSEVERITFVQSKSVSASLSLDSVVFDATTVTGYMKLNGINNQNFALSNYDESFTVADAANEIAMKLAATGKTFTGVTTYELALDRYKMVWTIAAAAKVLKAEKYTFTASINQVEVNKFFNSALTAASAAEATSTSSADAAYAALEITTATSTSVAQNSTASDTATVTKESVVALEGTKTLNFIITLYTDAAKTTAAGSNNEVTVVIKDDANSLDSTTLTTDGGKLTKDTVANQVSFMKKTNSSGQIAFTITADNAADGEYFTIDASGTLGATPKLDTTTVKWQEAQWTLIPAVADNFVIAPKASLAVDYTVVDQFGNLANADYQVAFTRARSSGTRLLATEANWSYVAPVSATGKAGVTLVDNGAAATEGVDTVTATLQKKATAGGAFINVTPASTDTFTVTYENDLTGMKASVNVNNNGIANAAGTDLEALKLETTTLKSYDSRIGGSKPEFVTDGTGTKGNVPTSAAGVTPVTYGADLLRVFGQVQTSSNAGIKGIAVRISATGANFANAKTIADSTLMLNDAITVFTDATGSYEAFVRSSVAGTQSINIDAQGVTSKIDVRFQGSTGVASSITLSMPATVQPGSRVDIVATVVDKLGSPVRNLPINFSDNGPGILNDDQVNTDPFGKAQVTLTTLATESGTTTITAWYEVAGKVTSVSKTISVAAPAAAEVAAKIGSFNGRVAVRVENAKGSTVSVKVGNRWYKYTAVNDNYLWSVRSVKGRSVSVSVYVDAELQNVQTITVR